MGKLPFLKLAFIMGLAIAILKGQCASAAQGTNFPEVPQALILSLGSNHYPAITHALMTVGFQAKEISAEIYGSLPQRPPTLLVVPEAEGRQLEPALVRAILREVDAGMPLLLDGPTPLAEKLGLKAAGARGEITEYQWGRYAQDSIELPGELAYPRFQQNSDLQVLAIDATDQAPLVVSGSHGKGRFICTAIPLEPRPGTVFQYLPFLAQAIVDQLHIAPSLGADNLCVYVDAGGDSKIDTGPLIAQLKRWSVREVHLGAFYQSKVFEEFVPRFLAAAHREGIAVYAWLEYPMVSQEFWNQHPEWREITASGIPAIMDWRSHMALEDPACFQAVAELTRRLVLDYDWDGVDFAELYFEGDTGIFHDPEDFTPMHPTFRGMFEKRYGVDPLTLFKPDSPNYGPKNPALRNDLQEYRVELITQLTQQFMEILGQCQAPKPYLQTTLTFIDALRDPTVTERFGVDPARLLALQQKYGFGVEVEDPYTVWNSSPDRYQAIAAYYRPHLQKGASFSMDVNVVERYPPGRPLDVPRGLEFYELLANVAANVDVVTLYAYSTLSKDDMQLAPFVLGAQQMIREPTEAGTVRAKRQLFWLTNTRGRTVYVDGREWPCRSDSRVLIPPGVHSVSTVPQAASSEPNALHIESVSGTIVGATQSGRHVTLTYESRGRCYLILNRTPNTVLCDGNARVGAIATNGAQTCVVLPHGKHTVELE